MSTTVVSTALATGLYIQRPDLPLRGGESSSRDHSPPARLPRSIERNWRLGQPDLRNLLRCHAETTSQTPAVNLGPNRVRLTDAWQVGPWGYRVLDEVHLAGPRYSDHYIVRSLPNDAEPRVKVAGVARRHLVLACWELDCVSPAAVRHSVGFLLVAGIRKPPEPDIRIRVWLPRIRVHDPPGDRVVCAVALYRCCSCRRCSYRCQTSSRRPLPSVPTSRSLR
jgi:hypothetical protein